MTTEEVEPAVNVVLSLKTLVQRAYTISGLCAILLSMQGTEKGEKHGV